MQIRLPRSSAPSVALPAPLPTFALPRARAAVVLVVDDEETVLEMTGRLLRRLGHEVIEASRPEVALRILEAGGISLLITDVVMPEMDGAELCAAARRFQPGLPVLFMSGYDPGLLAPFEAHDVLHKPFTSERLASAVAAALTHGTGPAGVAVGSAGVSVMARGSGEAPNHQK
jgi:CheY-like chemotaxis protein